MSSAARRTRRGVSRPAPAVRGFAAPAVAAVAIAGLLAGATACSGASVAGDDAGLELLVGQWRGVLLARGGELPFALRVDPEGSDPPAAVVNAGFDSPIESVIRQGAASYVLRFVAGLDSEIVAKMSPSGEELSGFWRYRRDSEQAAVLGIPAVTQVPFSATRDDSRRFQRNDPTLEIATPEGIAAIADLNGLWETFTPGLASPDLPASLLSRLPEAILDESLRTADFISQNDEHVVRQSNTDPPFMEGIYRNGLLRLSLFDGVRARLVHARAMPDGTLEGALWAPDLSERVWSWSARRH